MLSELGGFAVLSAGPLALLVLFVVGVVAVWIAARSGKSPRKRWAIGMLTAVVVIVIPTWDEIVGRAYFGHLCATNSGLRVLQQVKLGPDFRDVQFPRTPGLYNKTSLAPLYPYSLESRQDVPGPARIYYVKEMILDRKSGAILGTATNYFYRGGWFVNAFSPHVGGGGHCNLDDDYFKNLLERIFAVGR
jgi:hypothetical protein